MESITGGFSDQPEGPGLAKVGKDRVDWMAMVENRRHGKPSPGRPRRQQCEVVLAGNKAMPDDIWAEMTPEDLLEVERDFGLVLEGRAEPDADMAREATLNRILRWNRRHVERRTERFRKLFLDAAKARGEDIQIDILVNYIMAIRARVGLHVPGWQDQQAA